MSDELLTATEAAAFLKVSLRAFYAFRRRNAIPNRGIGRSLRFFKDDLLRARTRDAQSDRPTGAATVTQFSEYARRVARGEELRHA